MIDDWDYWEADDDVDEDYDYEARRQRQIDLEDCVVETLRQKQECEE